MSEAMIVVAGAGLLLAGIVKGATGIGYSTCALPFLTIALGLKQAIAIVVIPAFASNVATIWNMGNPSAVLLRFWRFYLAIGPGIAIGTAVLNVVDAASAAQLLGCLTLAYVGLAWVRPSMVLPPEMERPLALPAGFLNGVMTGITGSQVMPLMPFFLSLPLERQEQIQAINLAVTIASVILAISLAHGGFLTMEVATFSVAGAAPALVGTAIGNSMARHLSTVAFRHYLLATLAILALPLLYRTTGFAVNPTSEHAPVIANSNYGAMHVKTAN